MLIFRGVSGMIHPPKLVTWRFFFQAAPRTWIPPSSTKSWKLTSANPQFFFFFFEEISDGWRIGMRQICGTYTYIYIPGTPMTSIFEGQTSKQGLFQQKQRSFGFRVDNIPVCYIPVCMDPSWDWKRHIVASNLWLWTEEFWIILIFLWYVIYGS